LCYKQAVITAAIVFVICQSIVFVLFGWYLHRFWYLREKDRIKAELSNALQDFLTSPDADTPSPLAVLADQVALLLAARLMQQVKAMLAGVESGESKGEQLALINEAAGGSPWLALLSGILPARIRNKLLKNPQMIGALSKLGTGGTGGNSHHDTSGGKAPTSFSL
jgi:hypothetical protein